jgi:Tfp pilus assembly PilM family ATPase/Tfp pilus assembly protein PilN
MPFDGLKKVIGVDIGVDSIKAVLLSRNGQKVACNDIFVHHLPRSSEQPQEEILAGLKAMQAKMGRECRDVAVVSADRSIQLKFFDKPEMPLETLLSVVNTEMRQFIANLESNEGLDFVFHILGKSMTIEGSSILHLLSAVFPKQLVADQKTLLQKAGFRLVGMYPFAQAMWECYRLNYVTGDETDHMEPFLTTLVNFGCSTNQIAVCDLGFLRLGRIFPTGGEELTVSLAHKYNVRGQEVLVDRDQAEEMKKNLGLLSPEEMVTYSPDDLEVQVSTGLKRSLDRMAQKLRLSLDYFKGQIKIPVKKAFVFGGGANMKGLIQNLGDLLMVPEVFELYPLVNISYSPSAAEEPPPAETQSVIALAVGAGLCGMKSNEQTLNLISGSRLEILKWLKKVSTGMGMQVALFLLGAAILASYAHFFYQVPQAEYQNLMKEAGLVSQQISELTPHTARFSGLKKQLNVVQAKMKFLETIGKDRVSWSNSFLALAAIMPERTWLTEFTMQEEDFSKSPDANQKKRGLVTRISLTAISDLQERIPQFLQKLETLDFLTNVKIEDSRQEFREKTIPVFNFKISAEIRKSGETK